MDENEVFKAALKRYGSFAQIVMVFEEMSELQKELSKWLRGQNNVSQIAEEIADVEIMLSQMKMLFRCETLVNEYRHRKVERLADRLEKRANHDK
jgi:NTP pyrophosphatase (non-canonical NTP hydrolase)